MFGTGFEAANERRTFIGIGPGWNWGVPLSFNEITNQLIGDIYLKWPNKWPRKGIQFITLFDAGPNNTKIEIDEQEFTKRICKCFLILEGIKSHISTPLTVPIYARPELQPIIKQYVLDGGKIHFEYQHQPIVVFPYNSNILVEDENVVANEDKYTDMTYTAKYRSAKEGGGIFGFTTWIPNRNDIYVFNEGVKNLTSMKIGDVHVKNFADWYTLEEQASWKFISGGGIGTFFRDICNKDFTYDIKDTVFKHPLSNREVMYAWHVRGSLNTIPILTLPARPSLFPNANGTMTFRQIDAFTGILGNILVKYAFLRFPGYNWRAQSKIAGGDTYTITGGFDMSPCRHAGTFLGPTNHPVGLVSEADLFLAGVEFIGTQPKNPQSSNRDFATGKWAFNINDNIVSNFVVSLTMGKENVHVWKMEQVGQGLVSLNMAPFWYVSKDTKKILQDTFKEDYSGAYKLETDGSKGGLEIAAFLRYMVCKTPDEILFGV